MLKARGREDRVDHRSYKRQGVDRDPRRHYGRAAAHMVGRGIDHERLDEAMAGVDRQDAIRAIDRDLERLKDSDGRGGARGALGHETKNQNIDATGIAAARPRRGLIPGEVAMPTGLDTFARGEKPLTACTPASRKSHYSVGCAGRLTRSLVNNDELQAVLRQERSWLDPALRTIEEARRWRELEMRRFWPVVWRRWVLALVFALASAAAGGAGYAAVARPWAAEVNALREGAALADSVERRVVTMRPGERQTIRFADEMERTAETVTS
jgi:MobA/MobL family protein